MRQLRLFLTLMFLFSATSATSGELNGVFENNRGVGRFIEKKPVEAFDRFANALGELPYAADVHYNLATAFLANQEYPKAITEYTEAIRNAQGTSAADRETRFRSYFNMAQAYAAQKQIDEALETYQLALNENPDSIETKTNIELLTAQNQGDGKGDKDQQDPSNKDPKQGNQGDQKKDQKDPKDDPKKQDPKDGKDQKDKQENQPKPKPTPRPFDSKQISPKEVGTILDELKRQEEQIRAKMQNDKVKDGPVGKDW